MLPKKRAEDTGQKPLQLLEGEPSLLAETRRAFLRAHHSGYCKPCKKSYKETCSCVVTVFYFSVFRHTCYLCKLKQA